MTGHHPYVNHHTWRFALARLHKDQHAAQLVTDEIDACPGCWREIAEFVLGWLLQDMVEAVGFDQAVIFAQHLITSDLDAADRDRGEP